MSAQSAKCIYQKGEYVEKWKHVYKLFKNVQIMVIKPVFLSQKNLLNLFYESALWNPAFIFHWIIQEGFIEMRILCYWWCRFNTWSFVEIP